MLPGEYAEFVFNGNKCSLQIQEDYLEIQTNLKEAKTVDQFSRKLIPFFELISVKFIDSKEAQEKWKQGLTIASRTKLPHIEIKTVKRSKDHRWKLTHIKLKSSDAELCEKWSKILQGKIAKFSLSRPKNLLVFVNPYGGTGSAKNIYEKKVAPIFTEAGVKTDVITTSHKHEAKDYVRDADLSSYDGIIAVGGDGMLNEVANGLLTRTQLEHDGEVDAPNSDPRNSPTYHRPNLRVGVIPAGSTDCVSFVTQGINDVETSALHIVLGDSHPLDVVSLHNADGKLRQFSLSLTGYGYFGDMLRYSENYRWLGPPRYTVVGANVFLKNRSYSGEVHYLPADVDTDPRKDSFCRSPCSVCKSGLENSETGLFTPSAQNRTFELSITGESEKPKPHAGHVRNRSLSEGFNSIKTSEFLDYSAENAGGDTKMKFESEESEDGPSQKIIPSSKRDRPNTLPWKEGEKWEVIRGNFMSVNGVVMSCACERSPLGLSPHSHLSDGAVDLIVVKSCSRLEFLRYMIAHAGKGDRFDFPFVQVHRVKAFQFIPMQTALTSQCDVTAPSPSSSSGGRVHLSLEDLRVKYKRGRGSKPGKSERENNETSPVSSWNSDGEIIAEANIAVRVHRGLILLFCRGIESTD